jgi:hypothetical protein
MRSRGRRSTVGVGETKNLRWKLDQNGLPQQLNLNYASRAVGIRFSYDTANFKNNAGVARESPCGYRHAIPAARWTGVALGRLRGIIVIVSSSTAYRLRPASLLSLSFAARAECPAASAATRLEPVLPVLPACRATFGAETAGTPLLRPFRSPARGRSLSPGASPESSPRPGSCSTEPAP